MASNSASSVEKSFKYDVFLSFRGEDIRKSFVDHLYHALHHRGINTYKDDERIEIGGRIGDQLIRSIKDSRFHIIVFSENYASSSWCLDELVEIMECQKTKEQTAYPVFYHVEPTQVRNQSGAFGKAFEKHVEKGGAGRWRDALYEAAGLAGWDLETTFNGHEAPFIQMIVQHISLKLDFINFSVDENLVGMETRVENVVSSLELDSDDFRMIGIKGIGGGGKTTLARAVFDNISILFEGKSFVEDVKGSSLKELQKQVLSDLLNDQSIVVTSESEGKNKMKYHMRSIKVLLVLDDVDDSEQLQALAMPSWFSPGSRIIITSRDERVFVEHRLHADNIHDVGLLLDEEAICLFSKYAFGKEVPDQGYEELSGEVIRYADGLPLTIKVLGSDLYRRPKCEWVDTIKRLKQILPKTTLKILESSYTSLENDYKEIFLDVACILKGERKDDAIRILESCGFNAEIGLAVLKEKSLITISNDGRLLLHSRIEEMGWDIVRRVDPDEPSRHSRLWNKHEIEIILRYGSGTTATRSIKLLNTCLTPDVIMNGLRKMTKLRFIFVDNGNRNHECNYNNANLPNALQYVYWRNYPLCYLPKTFEAKKLVNLEMVGSNISQIWEGERKNLNKLKFLDLKDSHLRTFDLGTTLHLETLDLGGCNDFVELLMPAKPLKLKFLNLSGSKVCNLNLKLTPHLEKLTLSIKKTEHLPDSICMLKHLKSLELNSCWRLKQLPTDLDKLTCLEELHLIECSALKCIPDSICMIESLKSLHLPYASVMKLPDELGSLSCLKELNLEGAPCTIDLPDSILKKKGLRVVWSRGMLESYGLRYFEEVTHYTASCFV